MAISFVNSGSGDINLGGLFDATGADILFVAYTTTNETGPDGTRLGVTYNSVAMTFIDLVEANGTNNGGAVAQTYLYYMIAPPSGSHTIQTSAGAGGRYIAVAYVGSNQLPPESHAIGAHGPGAGLTLTVHPITDRSWGIAVFGYGSSTAFGSSSNFTARKTDIDNGTQRITMGDTNGIILAAPTDITGDVSPTDTKWGIAASFAPVSSGDSGFFFLF